MTRTEKTMNADQIYVRTELRRLPRGFHARQPSTNNINLIRVHRFFCPRHPRLRLGWRLDLVILHVAPEGVVVTSLDRLVVIAAAKQQHLNRKIDMRETRQPNALLHSRLLDYQRRARL